MKITPTMRRMVMDKEFFDAIALMIEAQSRLREVTAGRLRRDRLNDVYVPVDYTVPPYAPVARGATGAVKVKPALVKSLDGVIRSPLDD